jgi:acyl carrier protein phosphodiesterase
VIGSLLGDYVKGKDLSSQPSGVAQGIRLHRRIDAFTDAHPLVLAGKRRLVGTQGRCAGILVDLFYDHFLARSWREYSAVPLAQFAGEVYALFSRRAEELPERLRRMTRAMAAQHWLESYAELRGIESAVLRAAHRVTWDHQLPTAIDDLGRDYPLFQAEFAAFYPELIAEVARFFEAS